MPRISNLTIIVAYDLADDDRRSELEDYLTEVLGGVGRTESVYEFKYTPPPKYPRILQEIRAILEPEEGDVVFVWDLDDDARLRRIAVHDL
jgi:CRISPR/Cas system-associated endoribonuclease Cas2